MIDQILKKYGGAVWTLYDRTTKEFEAVYVGAGLHVWDCGETEQIARARLCDALARVLIEVKHDTTID